MGEHGTHTFAELDLEAIEDSQRLVKYAAENKANLKQDTVLALRKADESWRAAQWDSATAASFWTAFSDLCTAVNPVTIDTIYTNTPTAPRARWQVRLLNVQPLTSLSERTARRYMVLLLILLMTSIALGYVVTSTKDMIADVGTTLATEDRTVDALRARIREYEKNFGNKGKLFDNAAFPVNADIDQLTAIDEMEKSGAEIDQAVNRVNEELDSKLSLLAPGKSVASKPYDFLDKSISDLRLTIDNFFRQQSYISRTLPWIKGIVDFVSYALLPILLGTIGACAYVIRMIADQIRTTTFSRTSSIRHFVRVALGALAGVVLGFGGFLAPQTGAGSTLSAAALSFIAGYAVEPVFALFDKIAETFRVP